MASLSQLRTALASQLAAQLGSSIKVEKVPPDTVTGTTVVIGGMDTPEDAVFEGDRTTTVPVWVVVARKQPDFIEKLDDLCDTGSGGVPAAIYADPTLGGVVDSAAVKSIGDYRDMVIADVSHYAATVMVEVFH